ncbi:DUF305 domain-containing protein [Nonomuraea sp. NPDC049784]|uniref:DUF305 domain-containing protein n=1 Tax=Nonomuraea sp. NPDC049784 TaxID=3154361 RepID=UPI0033C0F465
MGRGQLPWVTPWSRVDDGRGSVRTQLKGSKGAAFDKMFVQMMVSHHNRAIERAKTEQAQGANPEAKELAKTIETAQQAEVEQMQKILDRL